MQAWNRPFTKTVKWSYSHFKYILWWGWSGINIKKTVFANPVFPQMKNDMVQNGPTSSFPEYKSFPDLSRIPPRPFPNLVWFILICVRSICEGIGIEIQNVIICFKGWPIFRLFGPVFPLVGLWPYMSVGGSVAQCGRSACRIILLVRI